MPRREEHVAVLVMGADRVGIVAGVSSVLAEHGTNILDLTSTEMRDLFIMIMLVDVTRCKVDLQTLQVALKAKGDELGVNVSAQHEDLFRFMHRV